MYLNGTFKSVCCNSYDFAKTRTEDRCAIRACREATGIKSVPATPATRTKITDLVESD